jgi:Pyridoxamine 5'-phosphate oxidase
MSRRDQIKMSAREVSAFLMQERTMICATIGPRGWPHLMPLWYVLRESQQGEPEVWAWTYAASQKVRNLERDPRASVQVEAGKTYPELRGVMLECEVRIHREIEIVSALGAEILLRNALPPDQPAPAQLDPQAQAAVVAQASKRVGLQFLERRRASFDHRKLGGIY